MRKQIKLLIFLSLISYLLSLSDRHTYALTMTDPSTELNLEEVTPTPTPLVALPTPTPIVPPKGVIQAQDFVADESDDTPLIFSISSDLVDFGPLSPTNPIIRTNSFYSTGESTRGLQLFSFEDQPLTSQKAVIEDTTCDNGLCKETSSQTWTNTLAFGFGYRCDGAICWNNFQKPDYFRQFANFKAGEFPVAFTSSLYSQSAKGSITYRVNISGSTDLSSPFQNTITFVAVPNL